MYMTQSLQNFQDLKYYCQKWRLKCGKKCQDPGANEIGYLSAMSRHKLRKAAEAVLATMTLTPHELIKVGAHHLIMTFHSHSLYLTYSNMTIC